MGRLGEGNLKCWQQPRVSATLSVLSLPAVRHLHTSSHLYPGTVLWYMRRVVHASIAAALALARAPSSESRRVHPTSSYESLLPTTFCILPACSLFGLPHRPVHTQLFCLSVWAFPRA